LILLKLPIPRVESMAVRGSRDYVPPNMPLLQHRGHPRHLAGALFGYMIVCRSARPKSDAKDP
jgi:hypothetical protein